MRKIKTVLKLVFLSVFLIPIVFYAFLRMYYERWTIEV